MSNFKNKMTKTVGMYNLFRSITLANFDDEEQTNQTHEVMLPLKTLAFYKLRLDISK